MDIFHISHLSKLNCLDLTACGRTTNESLKHISKLQNLRVLYLMKRNNIDNEGIEYLKFLTELRYLDMSFCNKVLPVAFSDILSELKYLNFINLEYCFKFEDEIGWIRNNFSNLTVKYHH